LRPSSQERQKVGSVSLEQAEDSEAVPDLEKIKVRREI
jgi:hypothetical protein